MIISNIKKFNKMLIIKKFNKNVNYFINYPYFLLKKYLKIKVTQNTIKLHSTIIGQILKNYVFQCKLNRVRDKSTWSLINLKNNHLHETFIKNFNTNYVLDNPNKSNLFKGLDWNTLDNHNERSNLYLHNMGYLVINKIFLFAEYLGLIEGFNPIKIYRHLTKEYPDLEQVIKLIEKKINFKLNFLNPFPGEIGIETSRGIITSNEIEALFDAWKIKQMVRQNDVILEIGGGLGRTAYYCFLFGIRDITIVDIPVSNLIQANYLFRKINNKNDIILENELNNFKKLNVINNKIKLISPNYFFNSRKKYKLTFNKDGFVELNYKNAIKYLNSLKNKTKIFYSINHEHNSFKIKDMILKIKHKNYFRNFYPLRRGYFEEVLDF